MKLIRLQYTPQGDAEGNIAVAIIALQSEAQRPVTIAYDKAGKFQLISRPPFTSPNILAQAEAYGRRLIRTLLQSITGENL